MGQAVSPSPSPGHPSPRLHLLVLARDWVLAPRELRVEVEWQGGAVLQPGGADGVGGGLGYQGEEARSRRGRQYLKVVVVPHGGDKGLFRMLLVPLLQVSLEGWPSSHTKVLDSDPGRSELLLVEQRRYERLIPGRGYRPVCSAATRSWLRPGWLVAGLQLTL